MSGRGFVSLACSGCQLELPADELEPLLKTLLAALPAEQRAAILDALGDDEPA